LYSILIGVCHFQIYVKGDDPIVLLVMYFLDFPIGLFVYLFKTKSMRMIVFQFYSLGFIFWFLIGSLIKFLSILSTQKIER